MALAIAQAYWRRAYSTRVLCSPHDVANGDALAGARNDAQQP